MENSFITKTISFIKKPPLVFQIIWHILFLLLIVAVVLLSIFLELFWIHYVVYSLTVIFFSYCLYLFIKYYKNSIKYYFHQKIIESKLYQSKISTNQFFMNNDKKVLFSILTISISTIYALAIMILAIVNNSLYYGLFAGYYFLLIIIKILVIVSILKDKNNVKKQHLMKLISSSLSMILNILVFVFVTYLVLVPHKIESDSTLVILIMSLYTFFKIVLALSSAIKWKTKDFLKVFLKRMSYVEILVTIIVLQTSMLSYYDATQDLNILNYVIGFVVCFLILCITLWLIIETIIEYHKFKKQLRNSLETNSKN